MACAVVLSAAVHGAAILAVGSHSTAIPALKPTPLQARLVALPAAPEVPGPKVVPRMPAAADRAAPAEKARAEAKESPSSTPPSPAPAAIEVPALEDIPDSTHYAARDLDVFPRLNGNLQPEYPAPALGERLAGRVTLLVLVDERGRVTDASVIDAIPAGVFEDSAREAFLQASFVPAERAGRAVRSRILVNVEFDPEKAAR